MARRGWMVALALCACGPQVGVDDTDGSTSAPTTTASTTISSTTDPADTSVGDPTGVVPGTNAVDILFVVDNSGTMGEAQGRLAIAVASLVTALEGRGVDWRIGVTTTDNGNPWCGTTSPEAGKLQASSCRSRTGEFVFNGNPPADATAIACTDLCDLDDLQIQPTSIPLDPEPRERPWLEPANLGPGTVATQVLACMLPQGIAGCGFESPLESAYKALLRMQTSEEESFGFLRDDALLMIVVVSDEADCSYDNEYQSIFLPASQGGNPAVFWSDPDASAPTSAVCWHAGVSCSGDNPFDECHAANKSVDGNVDVSDDDAVLMPLSRYLDYFAGLEAQKQAIDPALRVLVAVIGGVPPGYEHFNAEIEYALAADPLTQDAYGIGPACVQPDGIGLAVPAVREREVAEAFTSAGERNLWSVCEPSYTGAMAGVADMISQHTAGG